MQRRPTGQRTSTKPSSLNKGISRAMELLHSIKKQRELFSQTLSTAKMPKDLVSLDTSTCDKTENESDTESSEHHHHPYHRNHHNQQQQHLAVTEDKANMRKPLSPRNSTTRAGVSDARQLVSSLRNKREDLIKRFEKANLNGHNKNSLGGGDSTAIAISTTNELATSISRPKQKAVVDLSLLDDKKSPLLIEGNLLTGTTKSSRLAEQPSDLSMRVKTFQEKIKNMEESTAATGSSASEPPSDFRITKVSESLAKFEKAGSYHHPRTTTNNNNNNNEGSNSERRSTLPFAESANRGTPSSVVAAPKESSFRYRVSPPNTCSKQQQGDDGPSSSSSFIVDYPSRKIRTACKESSPQLDHYPRRLSSPLSSSIPVKSPRPSTSSANAAPCWANKRQQNESSSNEDHCGEYPSRSAAPSKNRSNEFEHDDQHNQRTHKVVSLSTTLPVNNKSYQQPTAAPSWTSKRNLTYQEDGILTSGSRHGRTTHGEPSLSVSDEQQQQHHHQQQQLQGEKTNSSKASVSWIKTPAAVESGFDDGDHNQKGPQDAAAAVSTTTTTTVRKCSKNGTVNNSWIKRACDELCAEAEKSTSSTLTTTNATPWMIKQQHDVVVNRNHEACIDRKVTAAAAAQEEQVDSITTKKPIEFRAALKSFAEREGRMETTDIRRQSTLSASAALGIDGKQKFLAEPAWMKKEDSNSTTPSNVRRKYGFPSSAADDDRCEHLGKQTSPAASWIKTKSNEGGTKSIRETEAARPLGAMEDSGTTTEDATSILQGNDECHERSQAPWIDQLSPDFGGGTKHRRRKTAENFYSLGPAGPLSPNASSNHDCISSPRRQPLKPQRRKSGDFSRIKKNGASIAKITNVMVPGTPKSLTPKAPWVKSSEHDEKTVTTPRMRSDREGDAAMFLRSSGAGRRHPGCGVAPTEIPASNGQKDAMDYADVQAEKSADHIESNDRPDLEPHNMALSAKVSMFESTNQESNEPRVSAAMSAKVSMFESPTKAKAVFSPRAGGKVFSPRAGGKVLRQNWGTPDRSQVGATITTPTSGIRSKRQSWGTPDRSQGAAAISTTPTAVAQVMRQSWGTQDRSQGAISTPSAGGQVMRQSWCAPDRFQGAVAISTPTAGGQVMRQSWCAPDRSHNAAATPTPTPTAAVKGMGQTWCMPDRPHDAIVKGGNTTQDETVVVNATNDQHVNCPALPRVTFTAKTSTPTNKKIFSLINKMEKFSQGGDYEQSESDRSEGEHNEGEYNYYDSCEEFESQSEHSEVGSPCSRALTPASSVERSIILEYGDAGFSFAEEEVEVVQQKSYLDEAASDGSDGSTYKIDNYQKEFNETIPIQSPWVDKPLTTSFDDFTEFVSTDRKNTMTIVSIAPRTPLPAPSSDCDNDVDDIIEPAVDDIIEPAYQEDSIREQRPPIDGSLATRKTYHNVARNSLLSARSTRFPRRSFSVDCISLSARDEPDPIFQVSDDAEHKSSSKRLLKKKFLSKPREDDGFNSQEENKPTSSKGVFKMLKKGLVATSSAKKDEPEHTFVEDIPDYESTVDEYYVRTPADSRTTISSITRSVNSHSGDAASQRSSDSKPTTMPLGVLNGFFKAARKLQKKSKRKSKSRHRGRSMSNKPPIERRPMPQQNVGSEDCKPTTASVPSTEGEEEVQLWPAGNYQVPQPQAHKNTQAVAPAAAAIGDRRFGTYGGLLFASNRSKALSEPQIQSMASW